jgi:hypothetical protein
MINSAPEDPERLVVSIDESYSNTISITNEFFHGTWREIHGRTILFSIDKIDELMAVLQKFRNKQYSSKSDQ